MTASPACALGLDLGTSSAKAVVIDTGGTVLSQASAGYAVTSARAGYAESEPADWWNAVTACTREAVHAAGAQPVAIGLSGQMHGLVMTARDGAALRTGRARTEGLITHRFTLDEYPAALDALRGDRTVHKIIIECWTS